MLFDGDGNRKYLVESEWRAFLGAADEAQPEARSFCWTLILTGARLSEVRALTPRRIDIETHSIRIECLKRRHRGVFREIPIGENLIQILQATHGLAALCSDQSLLDLPLWPWSRTTAWSHVKEVMISARLPRHLCVPKALRHTFGIEGVVNQNIPLSVMQKWMGHARFESTVVYTTPVGREERALASKMWVSGT